MTAKFVSFILEFAKMVMIVIIIAFIIRFFLVQPFIIEGNSMEPNFHNGQFILIDKISYRFHQVRRGDVVIFKNPNNESVYFIKRVIGLPGENIRIADDHVYINGRELSESYLPAGTHTYIENDPGKTEEVTLPANQFFVLGDNREQSSDSREWGTLPKREIAGRFWVVIYPFGSAYSKTNLNSERPLPSNS